MLGLFKKRSALEDFIGSLSVKKRKAIMLALIAIYRANRNSYTGKAPLLYIDFYGKLLNINRRKISAAANTTEFVKPLCECSELEKAGIILMLRGLTNINHEATGNKDKIIDFISRELDFEFSRFLEHPGKACDPQKLIMIFKDIIFPENLELIEGGKMITNLSKTKLKIADAEAYYISLAMNFELTPINSVADMQQELQDLGLCMNYESAAFLFEHLKTRFFKRLQKH